MKRCLSILLTFLLCFSSLPVDALASTTIDDNNPNAHYDTVVEEPEDVTPDVVEEPSPTIDDGASFIEEPAIEQEPEVEENVPSDIIVVDTPKELSDEVITDENLTTQVYSAKRLLVTSNTSDFDTFGATQVVKYGNLYVLSYDTESATEAAYNELSKTLDVEIDRVVQKESLVESCQTTVMQNKRAEGNKPNHALIALLDTGLKDYTDMRILNKGYNFTDEGFKDQDGHGQQMANIILQNTTQEVRILPIKVLGDDGHGTVLSLYLGILTAIDEGVDVINLSLGTYEKSDLLESIVAEAISKGIVVVAAAGNEHINTSHVYPASYPNVFTIGAVDDSGTIRPFSNFGKEVDYTCIGYHGTSEATAYFSATYASYICSYGKDNVVDELDKVVKDAGTPGRDDYYGKGIITDTVMNPDLQYLKDKAYDAKFKDNILEYTNEELMQMSPEDLDYLFSHRNQRDVGTVLIQATPEQHDYFLKSSKFLSEQKMWFGDDNEEVLSEDQQPDHWVVSYKYLESLARNDGVYAKNKMNGYSGACYIVNNVSGTSYTTTVSFTLSEEKTKKKHNGTKYDGMSTTVQRTVNFSGTTSNEPSGWNIHRLNDNKLTLKEKESDNFNVVLYSFTCRRALCHSAWGHNPHAQGYTGIGRWNRRKYNVNNNDPSDTISYSGNTTTAIFQMNVNNTDLVTSCRHFYYLFSGHGNQCSECRPAEHTGPDGAGNCTSCGDHFSHIVSAWGHSGGVCSAYCGTCGQWHSGVGYGVNAAGNCTRCNTHVSHITSSWVHSNGVCYRYCGTCGTNWDAVAYANAWGGTADVHIKCSRCQTPLSNAHSYTATQIKDPTCTVNGTTKYTCACGYSYTADDVAMLGHSYSTGYTYKDEPRKAEKILTCSRCHHKVVYPSTRCEVTHKTEPTCTKRGKYLYTYTFKDGSSKAHVPTDDNLKWIEKLGHDWSKVHYMYPEQGVGVGWQKCQRDGCHVRRSETVQAVHTITTQPTCTVKGWSLYTYNFHDPYTVQKQSLQDIPALGHAMVADTDQYLWSDDGKSCIGLIKCTRQGCNYTETLNADISSATLVPAKCTTWGTTRYTATFPSNDTYVTVTKDVVDLKPLGHDYAEPTYTWSSVNDCYAKRVCKREGCDHYEDELGETTPTTAVEPTCTQKGDTLYTVTFSNKAFKTQTKQITDIPALGHDYTGQAITYTWSADNSRCEAKVACGRKNCKYVLHESAESVYAEDPKRPPTCTENGYGTYTVVFKNDLFATQYKDSKNVPALGHDFSNVSYVWSVDNGQCTASSVCTRCSATITETVNTVKTVKRDATCTEAGSTHYVATFSKKEFKNQSKDVSDITPKGHTFGEPTFSWSPDNGSCTATRKCTVCDVTEYMTGLVTSKVVKEAKCDTDGETEYTAVFDNAYYPTQTKTVVAPKKLGHLWSTKWRTVGGKRYHYCEHTGCNAINETSVEYLITIKKGTGIATVPEPAFYPAGSSPTVSWTVAQGYHSNTTSKKFDKISEPAVYEATAALNTYKLKFDLNGGTYSGKALPTSATWDKDFTVNNPTRNKYSFIGWEITGMDDADHTYDTVVNNNKTFTVNAKTFKNLTSVNGATITLKALWGAESVDFTVNNFVQSIDGKSYAFNSTLKLKAPADSTVKVADYVADLTGFTYVAASVSKSIDATYPSKPVTVAKINVDGSTMINLFYTRNHYKATVTGDANFKSVTGSDTYAYGEKVNIKAVVNEGYGFTGWSSDDIIVPTQENGSFMMPAYNVDIKANSAPSSYTVNIVYNNGVNSISPTYNYNEEFTITAPTKVGYRFEGWKVTGMDDSTHVIDGANSTVTYIDNCMSTRFKNLRATEGTVTFTAQWAEEYYSLSFAMNCNVPVSDVSFSFMINGVHNELSRLHPKPTVTVIKPGDTITISSANKKDFKFIGWYVNGSDVPVQTVRITDCSEDMHLIAAFESTLKADDDDDDNHVTSGNPSKDVTHGLVVSDKNSTGASDDVWKGWGVTPDGFYRDPVTGDLVSSKDGVKRPSYLYLYL